jgi:putative transposase
MAGEQRQESVRLYDQHATLPARTAERPSLAGGQSQVLQNVAVRFDLAVTAFFRRCKAGEGPGYPRFGGQGRYGSITFPQVPVGCKPDVEAKRRRIANMGLVQVIRHRPIDGPPKTATLSRSSSGKWSVCFSSEWAEPSPLPQTGRQVGVDVGLRTFATLSTGAEIANPRFFRQEEQALAKGQRAPAPLATGAPERAKHRHVIARVHERTAWRRGACAHQHSRRMVNAFDVIALADLSINRLTQNHCRATSIHDAAWRQFTDLIAYKAACAGRQ